MKTLIVYFTRTGNTSSIAAAAAKELNADTLMIEPIEEMRGFEGLLNIVKLTALKKDVTLIPYETDVSEYDRIVIMSPVWAGRPCLPIIRFCKDEKFYIADANYVFTYAGKGIDAEACRRELDGILRIKSTGWKSKRMLFGKIKQEESSFEKESER